MANTPSAGRGFTTVAFEHSPKRGFLSVIIPVFDDVAGLTDTLTSLRQQTLPASEYEIIVANDGGAPGISALCAEFSVREVRIIPNAGSYYARNRAIEVAHGEHLAFVDADIQVKENGLEAGRSSLQSADYVGGPVIIREEFATTPARYHDMLTGFRALTGDNEHGFFVTGNLFVTRELIQRIGGFDERLRSGGDNEFGNRVFRRGEHVRRFVDDLTVFHPPRDYRELIRKRVRISRGRRMLNSMYPDRYRYSQRRVLKQLAAILLPPSVRAVRRRYPPNPHFGFLRYYLFRWRYKAELALRLFPVYYGRLRRESPVEPIVTVHSPASRETAGHAAERARRRASNEE